MTQNKVDKIAAGKVFEQLKDNEEKYKIFMFYDIFGTVTKGI